MDGVQFRVLAPGDVMAGVPIAVSGLIRDNSFSLTVTACNDVTCRTSTPRRISMWVYNNNYHKNYLGLFTKVFAQAIFAVLLLKV